MVRPTSAFNRQAATHPTKSAKWQTRTAGDKNPSWTFVHVWIRSKG